MAAARVTLEDLADAAKVSRTTVQKHLSGKLAVRWHYIEAYAAALSCSPEWLARGTGNTPASGPSVIVERAQVAGALDFTKPQARYLYARLQTGLSISEFSRRLRLTKQLVSKIELGRMVEPAATTVLRYEEVSGINARWLVYGRGPERRGAAVIAPINADLLRHAMQAVESAMQGQTAPLVLRARLVATTYELLASGSVQPDEIQARIGAILGI